MAAPKGALWDGDKYANLASILLFSQFPRKVFANSAKALEYDDRALCITKSILEKDKLKTYTYFERLFILLPLVYSENFQDAL